MSSYDIKGIVMWAAFLLICAAIVITSKIIKRRLKDSVYVADGMISRVEEDYDHDTHSVSYNRYVVYRDEEDGKEYEALLLDPCDLGPGSAVRIKYDPSNHLNVIFAEEP